MVKNILAMILRILFRLEIKGREHILSAPPGVLVVANHVSYLDGILLYAALPRRLTFAINTHIARARHVQIARWFVNLFTMDPLNPLSIRAIIKHLTQGETVVIFPEGRITTTGSLMKVYQGPGLAADRANVPILPVYIDGAQYSTFSYLKKLFPIRWFPKITLTIHPGHDIRVPAQMQGRLRREWASHILSDIMTNAAYASRGGQSSIFAGLLSALQTYGANHVVAEDVERKPVNYRQLLAKTLALNACVRRHTQPRECVGVLLPNCIALVALFLAIQLSGRLPALLNFSLGKQALLSTCRTAQIRCIVTSKRFISAAKLEPVIAELQAQVKIHYLEDLAAGLSLLDKIRFLIASRSRHYLQARYVQENSQDEPAVVLFTSGSEGEPKGVVLSHRNMLTNVAQIQARFDFNPQDAVINVLPMFHAFGLTMGTLMPLFSGIRTFYYPNPLHYKVIPELAYELNATILFGTNTFMAAYGRQAHPYDFHNVRYAFVGAEKLKEDVKQLWFEKFGLRILEGYGATETSPVISANTLMDYRSQSVGKLLPGMESRLQPVEGVEKGGILHVRGPNIMLGYMLPGNSGKIVFPGEEGWYNTGDIVEIDDDGYLFISGRLKRFAKIGGEMISLYVVEELAGQLWPEQTHAAVAMPDNRKGEQVVLVTDYQEADRHALVGEAKRQGLSDLYLPKKLIVVKAVPLLGSGKIDYVAVTRSLAHAD